ncbi:hypothetical protein JCM13580A_20380 [Streptomyces drozdowiczii]
MHLAFRQSTGPNDPLASDAASARAVPGAVVSIEQPLSVRVSAVTRATANPVPIDFLLLGTARHSLV